MKTTGPAAGRRLAALLCLLLGPGCAGPERGFLGHLRGRTELLAEAEEERPPPLSKRESRIAAFPLLFIERKPEREVVEVLWPFFEEGHTSGSRYFRLRPFFFRDRFRDRRRLVLFPFWFRLREQRETGERRVDHFWPIYGVHRRQIDLAPAVTHHVLFPLAYLRLGEGQLGEGRWKARLLPLATVSSGYLDRGFWLLPLVKAGTGRGGWKGGNRFLYLLDPLFAYERFSIALGTRPERPEDTRTEVRILGGLLGWEKSDGKSRLRLFWVRI